MPNQKIDGAVTEIADTIEDDDGMVHYDEITKVRVDNNDVQVTVVFVISESVGTTTL